MLYRQRHLALAMYIHRVLRTQFSGSRRTCIARLRDVWLAEVAMLKINRVVIITLFSLTKADHSEICPVTVGGDCGSQIPHHEEVWFIAPLHQSYYSPQFICGVFAHCSSQPMFIFLHIFLLDPQKATQRPLSTKSDEVRLAEEAFKKYGNPAPTIFSKVIDKSIPADIIYEDEKVRQHI